MTVNEKSKEQLLKELKQKNSQLKALKARLKKQEELFDKVINTTPVIIPLPELNFKR
jgi:shikimate 5-dehydrogenase